MSITDAVRGAAHQAEMYGFPAVVIKMPRYALTVFAGEIEKELHSGGSLFQGKAPYDGFEFCGVKFRPTI